MTASAAILAPKTSLEAADPVGLGGPFGVLEEAEVVERVDQARAAQAPRAEEVVGVDDVGGPEELLELGRRGAPEAARRLEVLMVEAAPHIAGLGEGGILRPAGVPKDIAESRVEQELVVGQKARQMADEVVGEEAAPCLVGAGLAHVEPDPHGAVRLR